MHTATAEAACLACRVEAGDGVALGIQSTSGEVGLDAAEALAGQDVQLHRDQRSGLGVKNLVWPRHANQLVATVVAGLADGVDLGILRERIIEFPVAGLDLQPHLLCVDDNVGGKFLHAGEQFVKGVGYDEVCPMFLERLDRAGCTLFHALCK